MLKRKLAALALCAAILTGMTACGQQPALKYDADLTLAADGQAECLPETPNDSIVTQPMSTAITPNSKRRTGDKTTLTPVKLTTQEKEIASMLGEYFAMFVDETGKASIGVKLYKNGELDSDFGYSKGDSKKSGTKWMISSGKLDGVNFNWQLMSLAGKTPFQTSLSATFLTDGRSFVRNAIWNTDTVQVQSGLESVLGYIAFLPGSGDKWENPSDVRLGANTTLNVIQGDLKQYPYCYVITAAIQ